MCGKLRKRKDNAGGWNRTAKLLLESTEEKASNIGQARQNHSLPNARFILDALLGIGHNGVDSRT
jgi:hypothetical protein